MIGDSATDAGSLFISLGQDTIWVVYFPSLTGNKWDTHTG